MQVDLASPENARAEILACVVLSSCKLIWLHRNAKTEILAFLPRLTLRNLLAVICFSSLKFLKLDVGLCRAVVTLRNLLAVICFSSLKFLKLDWGLYRAVVY